MKKVLIIFVLLFSILMPIANCNAETAVKTKFTENKEKEWHEKQLNENLETVEDANDSIRFVSTGRFGVFVKSIKFAGHEDLVNDFKIKINEKFYHQRDDHAHIFYELLSFDENQIKIKYTSTFDHRSFGKNIITTDTGIVNLKYK